MASHLSSIGMPVETNEDIIELLKKAIENFTTVSRKFKVGYYLKWVSKTGAELWLHLDKDNGIIGVNPFYNGESNFRTGIIKRIKRENDNEFEGAFYGWADPSENDPENGCYPFIFDCVNNSENDDIVLPCISNIKLSAFAHKIDTFIDDNDYKLSQKDKLPSVSVPKSFFSSETFSTSEKDNDEQFEVTIGSKSFFPYGTFSNSEKDEEKPEATFTGIILDYKLFTNELTNKKYYWIKTETYGGIIDVVVDPELIKKEIKKNGVISGVFYLCGKIINNSIL